ncbi:MAG: hypothetical protein EBQ92_13115, partial [Proteobacteria bacterium]|nr:hypothetical protein [Pseudomonadota bacterium]
MNVIQKHFALLAFIFLFGFRIAMLIAVQPGNAPDEIGHMAMALSLAQGKVLTLQESMELTRYPYPVYNPLGYLPSSIALAIGSFLKFTSLDVSKPFTFTATQNLIARLGMQLWTVLFLCFFLKLIRSQSFIRKIAFCLAVGLLPQLIFVQSYVNLDSIGLSVFLYLVWAVLEKREGHIAFATFLLGCCKLNFFCLYLLPCFYLWQNYRTNWLRAFQRATLLLMLPTALAFTWLIFSYFVNTRQYGSFLGFNALPDLYQSPKSGFRVFSLEFLNISLNSALGRFGWMSIRIPEIFSFPWRVLILPAALVLLFKKSRKGEDAVSRDWARLCLAIVIANFASHYW